MQQRRRNFSIGICVKFSSYLVGAKVIVYTDHATLKHLLIKKTPNHDSSVGFCSYKNSIWKSKIRKE